MPPRTLLRIITLALCMPLLHASDSRGDAEIKRGEQLRKQATPAARRQALEAYQSAAAAYREADDSKGLANALHLAGRILFDLEEYSNAIPLLEQAIALRRQSGAQLDLSNSLQTLGAAYWSLGNNQKAPAFFHEALAIRRSLNDKPGMATTLYAIALVHWVKGETQTAIQTFEQVLPLHRDLKSLAGEAHVLNAMGLTYANAGDHATAMRRYQQALLLWRKIPDPIGESYSLNNIGLSQAATGNHRAAIASYQQVLATARTAQEKRAIAYAMNNIAASYAALRDWPKAAHHYAAGLQGSREIANRLGEATALAGIARTCLEQNAPADAIQPATQSLDIRRATGERPGQAESLALLARAHHLLGNHDTASSHYAEALQLVETLRAQLSHQQLKAAHLESTQHFYEGFISSLMDAGRTADAFAVSERSRARVLLDLLAESKADLRRGADPALLQRQSALQSEINAAAQRTQQNPSPSARAQLDELLRSWDALDAELRASSPRYSALVRPQPLSVDHLRRLLLDDNTALLEFHLAPQKSYVWLITPTSIHSATLPSRARIESLARALYESLDGRLQASQEQDPTRRSLLLQQRDAAFQQSAATLSRILLAPLAPHLKATRLLIVPDGALHLVPFAALPWPASSQPLLARLEPHILPSASLVAQLRAAKPSRSPRTTISILADPVFQRDDARFPQPPPSIPTSSATSYPRLHFSRLEADSISRLLPSSQTLRALDFNASRAALSRPPFLNSRILHLATHAVIHPDQPALSGIVLSRLNPQGRPTDGLLRLYEISNLPLESDLVVLSACRTALGKHIRGEGVIGLTRAFLHAGASGVVTSLWSIQDRATAKLMEFFYEALLKQKLPPAAALRHAQLRLRADSRFAHPYFWAAFNLQGDGL